MGDLVYFVNDGKIVVTCPRCRFSKQISTAPFLAHPKHVKLRLKCRCGWVHKASLERRRQQRKFTKLEGRYIYLTDKFIHTEGAIVIKDLSSQGIGFTFRGFCRELRRCRGTRCRFNSESTNCPAPLLKKRCSSKALKGPASAPGF